MALAGAFGPFPARATQGSDSQITLSRMQSHGAMNVPTAGSGPVERANESHGAAQRLFEFEADTAPEMVEDAVCGLPCGLENPRGEVQGEGCRHAGFDERRQIGRRPVGFLGFLPDGRKATFGTLPVLPDRLLPLQVGDDAGVLCLPDSIGLKGEGDGVMGDRGGRGERERRAKGIGERRGSSN